MFALPTAITEDAAAEAEGPRTIYLIPEANFARFEKEMGKLSRRAEKIAGFPIKPFTIGFQMQDQKDGTLLKLLEVYLQCEQPKISGYTFVARIDHSNETGNIVRCVPNTGIELPVAFRNASPNCDHCRHRRLRRDTFIVRNDETGSFNQVGSTCLKDFFGHDPLKVARMAELLGYADEAARAESEPGEGHGLTDRRWVNLDSYLTYVASVIRTNGWVSGKVARQEGIDSTREIAWGRMHAKDAVTDADVALAEAALAWAHTLRDKAEPNEFEHNLLVVAEAAYIEFRSMGLAAAIVGCFPDRQRAPSSVQVGNMEGLIGLFRNAKESGLRFPKFHLSLDGEPVVLTLAGERSKAPGTVNVTDGGPYGDNTWYGRVDRDGKWSPSRQTTEGKMTALTDLLVRLSQEPAKTASEYGRLTGNCMFCVKPLKDARSTQVGYGQTCAKRVGLPWGQKAEAA